MNRVSYCAHDRSSLPFKHLREGNSVSPPGVQLLGRSRAHNPQGATNLYKMRGITLGVGGHIGSVVNY